MTSYCGLSPTPSTGGAFGRDTAYTFVPSADFYATGVEFYGDSGGSYTMRVGVSLGLPADSGAITWLTYADVAVTATGLYAVALTTPYLLTAGLTYALCAQRQSGSRGTRYDTAVVSSGCTSTRSGYYNNAASGAYSDLGNVGYQHNYRLTNDGSFPPVLTIVATDQGDGTCELAVTDAAHPGTAVYTSNFTAGVDSWTSGTDGAYAAPTLAGNITAADGTTKALRAISANTGGAQPWWDGLEWMRRALTGLTNGLSYQVELTLEVYDDQPVPRVHTTTASAGLQGDQDPTVPATSYGPTVLTHTWLQSGTTVTLEVRPHRTLESGGTNPARVRIHSVTVKSVAAGYGPLTIQRTDDNGTHYVRTVTDAAPDSSGDLTVIDAEPALTGTVTYVVRDGAGTLASDTVNMAQPTPVVGTVGYLTTLDVDRVDGYEGTRSYQVPNAVLPIVGRQDPLTTERADATWSLRTGTLTYAPQDSYADAQALVEVYTAGRVVMLRQATHPGLDLYHVATALRGPEPVYLAEDGWRWQVVVEYVEVGWPEGDLRGSADWTWAAVMDAELAWWNVAADYATWADLIVGP